MKGLYVRTNDSPEIIEIDGNLDELQKLVGGYIETVHFRDDIYILCDEEGLLKDKTINILVFKDDSFLYDIKGDFLVFRIIDGEFASLTGEQIIELKEVFNRGLIRL